jgi:hypothetical protein
LGIAASAQRVAETGCLGVGGVTMMIFTSTKMDDTAGRAIGLI